MKQKKKLILVKRDVFTYGESVGDIVKIETQKSKNTSITATIVPTTILCL